MVILTFAYGILSEFLLTPFTKGLWLAAIFFIGAAEIIVIYWAACPSLKDRALKLSESLLSFIYERINSRRPFEITINLIPGVAQNVQEEMLRSPEWKRFEAYEKNTVEEYNVRFSKKVMEIRDEIATIGFPEGQLSFLYHDPKNSEDIRLIGQRIGELADKIT